ncbi:hypothetical protein F5Y14DRAFT_429514 [Nemania sp. NC0429]|nr:hypothetical protein F5Y14DRAFT_429514 [Nemania sp. NC0429]
MPDDAAAPAAASGGSTGESLSCVTCRSRKLRCDKVKPVCTRCAKVSIACVYPDARKKPAFKRKNVRELEERLAQVEQLLRQAQDGGLAAAAAAGFGAATDADALTAEAVDVDACETPVPENVLFGGFDYSLSDNPLDDSAFIFNQEDATPFMGNPSEQPLGGFGDTLHGELMDFGGVFEALPPFEIMEDLNRSYFKQQHQFAPIIHPGRYIQAFYSPPHMRPPMCLQYAVWAIASNNDPKYHAYHDIFYRRARQYADMDEMKGNGEHFITVAHAQTWCILATDEAKSMMFTRAAMSCARAIRLSGMMGLHHLDSPPDESSPTLAPPQDWAELEERRRVFWGIFSLDSHCSISTGWPHLIDVADVSTHLPATEAAFHSGEPMETCSIHDVFKRGYAYSSFAGSVIVCHLFNLILKHAHRPKESDSPENYEYGEYWKRHRDIDNTLSSAFMFLPEPFRLPENYRESTAVNTNLNLHAAIICLHHAALERIETHNLSDSIKRISQGRLAAAAQEIVDILKLTSHLNSGTRTPLAALSLFCAASVYMYFCQQNPTPSNTDNLDFILSAMEAIGRTHSLTRSFLRQAILDIEQNGVQEIVRLPRVTRLTQYLTNMVTHNIPLLVRTRLSRHSAAQPPQPGLPAGRTKPRGVPLSTPWVRPAQMPGSASVSSGGGSDSHAHKRQRTTTTTSLHSSLPYTYSHVRSEPTPTSNHSKTDTPISNVSQITTPSNPTKSPTNGSQNGIGVTIAPGVMGRSGPKPFKTTGREAWQTRTSIGGTGSWEISGLCASALAGGETGATPSGDEFPADYVYPGDAGFDWDVLDTNLGMMGTSIELRTQGERSQNVDGGGAGPGVG